MEDSNKVARVQISLYAQGLKNVAGLGKGTSDPYAVVTLIASDPHDKPKVLGQTEVIKNTLSPTWAKSFLIDYEFGKPTRVNVGIYDEIRKAKNNKPMGSAVFEIGEVLGSRGNIKAKKLKHGGTVFARVEKAPERDAGTFHLAMRGIKLKNVDGLFGKSDPFFEISRLIRAAGGPSWQLVYRSKHINNDLNPKWEPVSISMNQLCDGDKDKPILITVNDWEKSGKHSPMGTFETTVNGLMNAKTNGGTGDVKSIDTKNAFHLKRKGKDFGMIVVTTATITGGSNEPVTSTDSTPASESTVPFSMALGPIPGAQQQSEQRGSDSEQYPSALPMPMAPPAAYAVPQPQRRPTFVDYVTGGLELQMSVAVDFTGSNGDPRRPGTLHYIHPDGQLNDYEKALSAVGSIVARYDSDQKFPVWGFGAKYHGVINHCFQLGREAEASGIGGILEAYRGTFKTGLTMSGPTIFAEVIELAAAQARSAQEAARRVGKQAYGILLILTDGAVSDINGTKRAIVAASDAPLSIVIIGIGDADFSAMQFLDDFQAQEGNSRDICQFVEFSRHKSNKISLTQATLEEIPDQVVEYFHGRGIKPLPPITGSKVNVLADDYSEDEDIDLSMEYNSEGEICLADNEGVYDDTGYGDFSTYAGVAILPPPTNPNLNGGPAQPSVSHYPGAPNAPYGQPAHPVAQQSQQPYIRTSPAPSPVPYSQQYGAPSQPVQAQPFVVPGNQPSAQAVPPPVFHVQVPAGVSPGVQLQVQNPSTGQNMIVTVPPGVPPGGTFAVAYQ